MKPFSALLLLSVAFYAITLSQGQYDREITVGTVPPCHSQFPSPQASPYPCQSHVLENKAFVPRFLII
jgi:hypothetical protein